MISVCDRMWVFCTSETPEGEQAADVHCSLEIRGGSASPALMSATCDYMGVTPVVPGCAKFRICFCWCCHQFFLVSHSFYRGFTFFLQGFFSLALSKLYMFCT